MRVYLIITFEIALLLYIGTLGWSDYVSELIRDALSQNLSLIFMFPSVII